MTAQARNGSQTELRLKRLETKCEEQDQQIQRLALGMAGILAQMAQPQVQQTIVEQLLHGQPAPQPDPQE
jgi:uncharacterized coiled-coil protein SlyX